MTAKPYLQLRDRISQAWLNKYTILLTLIALKLLLFQQSLNSSLESSKFYTISSCPTIDSYVSNLVSFPHYIAKSSNFIILKTLEEINEKTIDTLKLILTASENVIIFALEMIVGTYACVLVSTIDGAVDVAVNSTESIIGWVNDTLGDITDDIEDGLTDISNFLNKAVSAAEKVKDFFDDDDDDDSGNSTLATVNLTVSSLKNLHIPSSVNSKLEALKDNTPDFEEVKNKTESLIRTPFELIKDKISNTIAMSTEGDSLYVPDLEEVTICSDNTDKINEFYDHLANDIGYMVKVFVVLLILGALIALIPIIYEEFRLWKKMSILRRELSVMSQRTNPKDPIELVESTFNKYPSAVGVIASKVTHNPETKVSIRWITSYVISSRAIVVLGIAMAGILAVVLQFILLGILSKSISKNRTKFTEITDEITFKINDSISNWTDSTNDYLESKENSINEDVFSWVRTATDSVNDTVSSFVAEMNDAISDAFNGTILYAPVKTIVGCVIEDKLIKIEKGLTWIHDNAEFSLPRVNEEYLSEAWGNDTQGSDTTGAISKASLMIERTESLMTKMLKEILEQYKKSLKFELYISLALLGLWVLQFAIGLLIFFARRCTFLKNSKSKDEKMNIGYPRQLTEEEQKMYGYPLTGNLKVMHLSANPFADEIKPQNPFEDEKNVIEQESPKGEMNTTESASIFENDMLPTYRLDKVPSSFDDEKNDLGYGENSHWG